jgi:DNA polymerase-3 subunit delta
LKIEELGMIIFLHGSDTYRSRQKLKDLQTKFKKEVDPQGYNLSFLSGKDTTMSQVLDALSAAPFMATKRMVIVEEITNLDCSDKEEESFCSLAESLLEDETIFVVWEAGLGKRDLKKSILQPLLKSKYVMPFEAWNAQQVAGWMNQEFQQAGITINGDALQHISLAIGDNSWKAASEVKKLIAYAQANQKTQLTREDIALMVPEGALDNIFELVDAVSQGRRSEALKRLHDQIRSGNHELEILGMLVRQFRILQQVKDGLDQRMTPDQIASHYGMHPFVAKKMSSQARRFNQETIRQSYELLTDVDHAIKSSGLPPNMLLSKTVAEISQ